MAKVSSAEVAAAKEAKERVSSARGVRAHFLGLHHHPLPVEVTRALGPIQAPALITVRTLDQGQDPDIMDPMVGRGMDPTTLDLTLDSKLKDHTALREVVPTMTVVDMVPPLITEDKGPETIMEEEAALEHRLQVIPQRIGRTTVGAFTRLATPFRAIRTGASWETVVIVQGATVRCASAG